MTTNIADKLRKKPFIPTWLLVIVLIVLVLAAVVGARALGIFDPPTSDTPRAQAGVHAQVFHKLLTEHPAKSLVPPPPPVVVEPEPVSGGGGGNSGGGGGGGGALTCEQQGLYTVGGSCVADLCASYGDLDGDGVATDCLAYYTSFRWIEHEPEVISA